MGRERKIGALLSYSNIIIKNLINFIYTPFLLKYLGQSDYGLFQMTNSVILSLSLLSMGFSSAYVKFYVSYKVKSEFEKIKKLNGMYLLMFLFMGFIAGIIGFFLVMNIESIFNRSLTTQEIITTKQLMIIMTINIVLTFPSSVFDSNIMVNEKFIFQQIRQLLQSILVPIIAIPMILLGVGVLSIGITQTVVTLIFLLLNISFCVRKIDMRFNFKDLPLPLLKELALFSFFVFLNQIVDLVNNNAPNFILGVLQGAKQVAIFSIAIQLKNMFFMLSTSLSSIFIPKINELVNKNETKNSLTDLMIRVGRIQMTILLFILGGFIILGKYFINLWAGNENQFAYVLVIIMVFPSIIPLSQNVGIEIQRAMNKHIFRSIVCTIFAVINIILTILGTYYIGLVGATIGYITSIVCANGILMNWYYHNKIGLNMNRYWKETINVIIPFLITVIILLAVSKYIPITSIYTFLVFGVIYVLVYLTMYWNFVATIYEKNILSRKR